MDDCIEIVHQHPFCIAGSFRMGRHCMHFIFHLFIDAVRNGFYMRVGIAFANNKKIGGRILQSPQIELYNIFTFFIPNPFNNQVVQLFGVRIAGFYPLDGCKTQIKKKNK